MPGRKIRDERDALDCLRRLEDSGLELRDWARENRIDGRSLHCWRMSLERGREQEPARLVELVADTAPAASATPLKGGARYVIRTVHPHDGFLDATDGAMSATVSWQRGGTLMRHTPSRMQYRQTDVAQARQR